MAAVHVSGTTCGCRGPGIYLPPAPLCALHDLAPDLLAALRAVCGCPDFNRVEEEGCDCRDRAESAIARAEGRDVSP